MWTFAKLIEDLPEGDGSKARAVLSPIDAKPYAQEPGGAVDVYALPWQKSTVVAGSFVAVSTLSQQCFEYIWPDSDWHVPSGALCVCQAPAPEA